MKEYDPVRFERGYGSGFQRFQDLMSWRVHDILLVSSIYDSFILEEDGRLDEGLIHEYIGLNLVHLPRMGRASSGKRALEIVTNRSRPVDVIIATMHLGDMSAFEFARQVREAGIDVPVVLLTYDERELVDLVERKGVENFENVFLWTGDFRILIAVVKAVEDRRNVRWDTDLVGVQSIIVIEDSVRFYSSYLPIIYSELMRHSQDVLSESINRPHRIMRMRARPKILLCHDYETAWEYFEEYHENVLGVISDIEFPREGEPDPQAGIQFARNVRAVHPDIPILLQSSAPEMKKKADELNVSFLEKGSVLLLHDLRRFMIDHLGFGDFVFKGADGKEVARAKDLASLEECLAAIPEDSLLWHAQRNHFSSWLKARTEFWLAHQLRPRRVTDYESAEHLRQDIIQRLRRFRKERQKGSTIDFDPNQFDDAGTFARIGGGSLGGKGRGLAFVSRLVETYGIGDRFEGVSIQVPAAVVVGTDVFDEFLELNHLRDFALSTGDDAKIERRFLSAPLPEHAVDQLRAFVDRIRYPLAVRSSSLLEDSKHQPFAGIYSTYMVPNNRGSFEKRLEDVLSAVKRVYASTFGLRAKAYTKATSHRLEEEKMAVVIQRLVGTAHDHRFYPDFAGVARSHNFYPAGPMKSDDGIASVALGLGAFVVEGGAAVRFCPRYPHHLIQFSSVEDTLNYAQRHFYALELRNGESGPIENSGLSKFDLSTAKEDGVLGLVGSIYSMENNAIYDGVARPGVPLVTFAPILKHDRFPLPEILDTVLEIGRWSMSAAVEMEFAVNCSVEPGEPKQFSILQMRPMVVGQEQEVVEADAESADRLVCESRQVLGNGIIEDIRDVVLVDITEFDRSMTREVAGQIGRLNHRLSSEGIPYILFGVGRWGSSDPWLGIPVKWEEISGAGVIVESNFLDLKVTPSQGSHFFQNLATMRIGYFTVEAEEDGGILDWDWLLAQEAAHAESLSRHVRLPEPLTVRMDGRTGHGVILRA
ncbi:MAG: PEP/pyruvate-binding domain-containing protein [Planctomycetota bacterium]